MLCLKMETLQKFGANRHAIKTVSLLIEFWQNLFTFHDQWPLEGISGYERKSNIQNIFTLSETCLYQYFFLTELEADLMVSVYYVYVVISIPSSLSAHAPSDFCFVCLKRKCDDIEAHSIYLIELCVDWFI